MPLKLFAEVTGEEAKMWGPSIIGFGKYHYRYASAMKAMPRWFSAAKDGADALFMSPDGKREELLAKSENTKSERGACTSINFPDIDTAVLKEMIREDIASMRTNFTQNKPLTNRSRLLRLHSRSNRFEKFQKARRSGGRARHV